MESMNEAPDSVFLLSVTFSYAQTATYSPAPCLSGTTGASGITIGISCAVNYSKNGPNAASRNFDLYYPNSLGSSNTSAAAVVYIHGDGWATGSSQFNWLSNLPNPDGYAKFVGTSGYNIYAANFTQAAGTPATQNPAQQQDLDCMLRSLVHNRGTAGFSGSGQIFMWGSGSGAYLALLLSQSGPLTNANCEYTDSRSIHGVFANSPVTDLVASYGDNNLANSAQMQSFIRGYIPCSDVITCAGAAAAAVSPINLVTANPIRTMLIAGTQDTWVNQFSQSQAMWNKYLSVSPTYPVAFQFASGYGHLLDEQTGGITGVVQQVALQFFRDAQVSRHTTGVVASAGTVAATQTASVTISTAGTLSAITVLTAGAAGQDFIKVAGGSCAVGTIYSVGQTCTVAYSFTPTHPWSRNGGITLADASGRLLGNSFVTGTGTSPQVSYLLATGAPPTLVTSALLNPEGLAVDGNGNIYVADYSNKVVKQIVAVGGIIPSNSIVNAVVTGLTSPASVAVDGSGNVYVADSSTNTIREVIAVGGTIPANPAINTLGSGFNSPTGVAVDGSGNVYVADFFNNAVKQIVAVNGVIPANPTINSLGGGFYHVAGVAIDGSGNVYVADSGNGAVKRVPPGCLSAACVVTISSTFSQPRAVAVDGTGNLYVTDTNHNSLKELLAVGGVVPANPTILTLSSTLLHPEGVAIDSSGNVFVSNYNNSQLLELNAQTPPTLTFASTPVGVSSSDSPKTVTITNNGNSSLILAIPVSGTNPTIPTSFVLSASSTCPQLNSSSSTSGQLAAGASCTDIFSFVPTRSGSISGASTTTDNNLGTVGSTQTILMSGTGTSGALAVNVNASTVPAGTSSTTLSATVTYGGAAPTGAVTFTVNGTTIPASCSAVSFTETCTAT